MGEATSGQKAIVVHFNTPGRTNAADVVFLHGRGGTERDTGALVAAFPDATLRGYRGPIREGGGFAWFTIRAIGVAHPESLAREIPKVAGWISADNGANKPWLCGFSNGAAMAASIALSAPSDYAGLIMIAGCFATDALPAERLDGMPVLFCQGRSNWVIPPAKFAQARSYLEHDSGADATILEYEGGHDVPVDLIASIARWHQARH